MIKGSRLVWASLSASLLAPPVGAAPLQPTGKWVVSYEEAQCVAMRNYGSDKSALFLILKPSPESGVMRLLVMEDGPTHSATPESGSLRFGLSAARKADFVRYPDRDTKSRLVAVNLPMHELKANAGVPTIHVKVDFVNDEFAVPELKQVLAALDECMTDLREAWNVPSEASPAVARKASSERPLYQYLSPRDYPRAALIQRQEGTVKLTLLIDAEGAVKDCSVEETSGIAALDTMSCYSIVSRAKFKPAAGPDGKPVKSSYHTRITWRLGGK